MTSIPKSNELADDKVVADIICDHNNESTAIKETQSDHNLYTSEPINLNKNELEVVNIVEKDVYLDDLSGYDGCDD